MTQSSVVFCTEHLHHQFISVFCDSKGEIQKLYLTNKIYPRNKKMQTEEKQRFLN